MLYLTAQPDTFYFLWQLKLQLHNFRCIGIPPECVHVLIGFDPQKGLNSEFKTFIQNNKQAQFFTYTDDRVRKQYVVSLRPHIIAKHLEKFEELESETIFFLDSDVIFKERPALEDLFLDDTWYASDTRNYLNSSYITESGGSEVFEQMCRIVGITPELVKLNDAHAGGAQLLFKKSTVSFWRTVEQQCEEMYAFLMEHNRNLMITVKDAKRKGIQHWCAEMWVLWWNVLKIGKSFQIHEKLNFCMAHYGIESWERCNILHYTGITNHEDKKVFDKAMYLNHSPMNADLSEISKEGCSYLIKLLIDDYNSIHDYRRDLSDVTFVIIFNNEIEDLTEDVKLSIQRLRRSFKTRFLLVEIGMRAAFKTTQNDDQVDHYFVNTIERNVLFSEILEDAVARISTNHCCVLDLSTIVSDATMQLLFQSSCSSRRVFSLINSDHLKVVDSLTKSLFDKIADIKLLEYNVRKFKQMANRKISGPIFVNLPRYRVSGRKLSDFYEPLITQHQIDALQSKYEVRYLKKDLYKFSKYAHLSVSSLSVHSHTKEF